MSIGKYILGSVKSNASFCNVKGDHSPTTQIVELNSYTICSFNYLRFPRDI